MCLLSASLSPLVSLYSLTDMVEEDYSVVEEDGQGTRVRCYLPSAPTVAQPMTEGVVVAPNIPGSGSAKGYKSRTRRTSLGRESYRCRPILGVVAQPRDVDPGRSR